MVLAIADLAIIVERLPGVDTGEDSLFQSPKVLFLRVVQCEYLLELIIGDFDKLRYSLCA